MMNRAWILSGILRDVELEIDRAESKHPSWPSDLLRQVMVVTEEMGEVQKAALNLTEEAERPLGQEMPESREERLKRMAMDMDEEMVQVAAMALRFLYNRRINRDRK
jgi:hypothetical protein